MSPVCHIQSEQRRRWKSGERVCIEAFFEGKPAAVLNREDLLKLIYNEICLREESGESLSAEDYLARFPDRARELKILLQLHRAMQLDRGSLSEPPQLSNHIPQWPCLSPPSPAPSGS